MKNLRIEYCMRTLTKYSRINYMDHCITKQVLNIVYNGHVFL